jgi:NAD(P)-dependent dehydrogenase (short-subunit alcohol dehydrogenase family)
MPQILRCPPSLLSMNLTGKTYVVTGGNSGIGKETVKQLVSQGASVILACRRPEEGERARAEILASVTGGKIQVETLDLASLESVRTFAQKVLRSTPALHGLVNNAGVMNTPFGKTRDGFELQFGTNHLGHFLLTELLLPSMKAGAPSRVVIVSSCFHDKAFGREGRIDFEDLNFEKKKYDGWKAYAQSKLANLLHARHLGRKLAGSGISVASVHPGWVRSNLIQHSMPVWAQDYVLFPLLKLAGMIEPKDGAQSSLYALLAPEVESLSGSYFSQVGIYRTREAARGGWPLQSPNPNAHDDAAAERLDRVSCQSVGLA